MYHQLTRHLLSVLVDQLGSNVQLVGDPAQHLRHHHTRLVHNVRVGESEAQSRLVDKRPLNICHSLDWPDWKKAQV